MCGYEKPKYLISYLALFRFVAMVGFISLVSLMLRDGNGLNGMKGWERRKEKYTASDFTVGSVP